MSRGCPAAAGVVQLPVECHCAEAHDVTGQASSWACVALPLAGCVLHLSPGYPDTLMSEPCIRLGSSVGRTRVPTPFVGSPHQPRGLLPRDANFVLPMALLSVIKPKSDCGSCDERHAL